MEGLTSNTPSGEILRVREVWQDNLDEELEVIRSIVDDYPYIAMDTEFPGVVARPVGNFKSSGEFIYQTLRYVAGGLCLSPKFLCNFQESAAANYLADLASCMQVQCGHAETHSARPHLHRQRRQAPHLRRRASSVAIQFQVS